MLEGFEVLKQQPRSKELEINFTSLEGSILTAIDSLRRKAKHLKLNSPAVNDIQMAVETLEVMMHIFYTVLMFLIRTEKDNEKYFLSTLLNLEFFYTIILFFIMILYNDLMFIFQ